jgi:hypothetical protein
VSTVARLAVAAVERVRDRQVEAVVAVGER